MKIISKNILVEGRRVSCQLEYSDLEEAFMLTFSLKLLRESGLEKIAFSSDNKRIAIYSRLVKKMGLEVLEIIDYENGIYDYLISVK